MRNALLLGFFLLFAGLCYGQRFLQLERTNSAKTRKYFPGDEITFQIDKGQWYTRVIEDVSYEQNLVIFAIGSVSVDSISALRSFQRRRWSRPLGNQFYNFAILWTGYSLIADVASKEPEDDFTATSAVVAGSALATGFLIKKLFRQRTFYFSKNKKGEVKKWRLRTLDLEVRPLPSAP